MDKFGLMDKRVGERMDWWWMDGWMTQAISKPRSPCDIRHLAVTFANAPTLLVTATATTTTTVTALTATAPTTATIITSTNDINETTTIAPNSTATTAAAAAATTTTTTTTHLTSYREYRF